MYIKHETRYKKILLLIYFVKKISRGQLGKKEIQYGKINVTKRLGLQQIKTKKFHPTQRTLAEIRKFYFNPFTKNEFYQITID